MTSWKKTSVKTAVHYIDWKSTLHRMRTPSVSPFPLPRPSLFPNPFTSPSILLLSLHLEADSSNAGSVTKIETETESRAPSKTHQLLNLSAMARVAGEQRKNFENETPAATEAFREQKRIWRVVLLTSSGMPLGGIRRQGGIE